MRRVWILACLGGCFYNAQSPLPEDFGKCTVANDGTSAIPQPTWYRDIAPLVAVKCQGCHTDGGIAPFPISYEELRAERETIRDAVTARVMPPWQPAPCCNHYRWDRSLTDGELQTFVDWLDAGLPAGDPSTATPIPPQAKGLPRVDLTATMPAGFTPTPKVGADELRCFLLDHAPIETTRYITGFDFKPGARGEVHHVVVFTIDEADAADVAAKDGADGRPGWDCWGQGNELGGSKQFIGGWQPGELPRILPDGIGRALEAHQRIAIQIHYDTGHGVAPDQSSIDIMLEDHVDRLERAAPVGNPLWFVGDGMEIPAGAPDTKVWFEYDPTILTKDKPFEIHDVMLHMHELGSIGRVAILHPDGTSECLLNIPAWNFHWMADYYFETPAVVSPGDRVYVECHWDNTQAHQKVVNGMQQTPQTLHWGTDQEMCGAVLTYSEAL